MVERFFRSLSTDRVERGVFKSVPELIAAINEYIAVHNENPKPFVWTAKVNDILQKVIRANRRFGLKKNEATTLDEEMVRAYIRPQEQEDDRYDQMKLGLQPPLGGSRVTSAFEAPQQ